MSTGFLADQGKPHGHASADLLTGFVPFPEDRAKAYRDAGYWTGQPLDSILTDAAARWPDRTAIVDAATSYSFAELAAVADRVAAGLAELGITEGDRVMVQLPNSCQFAVALFGLLRAGAVPVMCLPGHRTAELGHFAEVSGAVALIVADKVGGFDYRDMAATLVAEHSALRHVIVDGDCADEIILIGADGSVAVASLRDGALVPYVESWPTSVDAAVGDFDGDGLRELALTTPEGEVWLWRP